MKKRSIKPATGDNRALDGLVQALLALDSPAQMRAFLVDLCTPAELQALADRWRVVPLLTEGVAYRDIHERTAVSVTTIGRIARCLEMGSGGYRHALDQLAQRAAVSPR
ncbi:MAG: hypothetical protein CVV14_01070 [Gammaproteobacteria bacterium HGW-Gammaproteobacteria-4]|jgi:TrpR-related protein YerC/YecD|nr:MAG: hypothetical protein CVV14_01070 [Gammaproteobacteria bacterium HGW-Gammaproteobacteria-4]